MDNFMLSHHPTRVVTLISAVMQIYNVPLSMKKLPVTLNSVKNIDCEFSMNNERTSSPSEDLEQKTGQPSVGQLLCLAENLGSTFFGWVPC